MKADFAMVLHFHQPVGNFGHVIERACDECYIPFLEVLARYPEIRMTFHFGGYLLEWSEKNRPRIFGLVREMVKAGQIEMMSGGFYEPILSAIPPGDRLSQIRMLSEYVRSNFSYEAKGAWIAERVWEPTLPSALHDAGIKYVVLDDTHFLYSGVPKNRTYGYYITEDNAKAVAVFPSDKVLRYLIPFKMPSESMDYMRGVLREGADPLFVYGDDGEKFGEWPGTHKWVFEERWLEQFFNEIMQNADWLRTVKLSECFTARPSEGKVYLPAASYEEMLEWALPAEGAQQMENMFEDLRLSGKEELYKPFIRGGFWRNFMVKYPEADHMNKRMIYASEKLSEFRAGRKAKPDLAAAEKDLFRGQCSCAYWHGIYGGLYLFHLRRAIYHYLIRSGVLMDRARYGRRQFCEAVVSDIDADGFDEVVLENREVSLYFDPAEGGILKELDSKTVCQNLINSLARRKEAYHGKILDKIRQREAEEADGVRTIHDDIQTADARLKDYLDYDWYGRYSLIDHFLGEDVDIGAFSRCDYREAGDFVKGIYDFEVKRSRRGITLVMKREGRVDGSRVHLVKEITLPGKGSSFKVRYSFTGGENTPMDLIFAPEFNVTMPDADSERYSLVVDDGEKCHHLGDTVQHEGARKIEIRDADKGLSFMMILGEECPFWHFPVKTVSQSEKEYELHYQSSVLLPRVKLKLVPGEEKQFDLEVKLI